MYDYLFPTLLISYNMPRTPCCKCVECEETFDGNEVHVIVDGLMRLFPAVRLFIELVLMMLFVKIVDHIFYMGN